MDYRDIGHIFRGAFVSVCITPFQFGAWSHVAVEDISICIRLLKVLVHLRIKLPVESMWESRSEFPWSNKCEKSTETSWSLWPVSIDFSTSNFAATSETLVKLPPSWPLVQSICALHYHIFSLLDALTNELLPMYWMLSGGVLMIPC